MLFIVDLSTSPLSFSCCFFSGRRRGISLLRKRLTFLFHFRFIVSSFWAVKAIHLRLTVSLMNFEFALNIFLFCHKYSTTIIFTRVLYFLFMFFRILKCNSLSFCTSLEFSCSAWRFFLCLCTFCSDLHFYHAQRFVMSSFS